jgi:beta-lactamase regulating signal transducer with metallopeptidase domain/HEAT repeat protein
MRHFIDTILEPALWFAADWSLRWAALLAVAAMLLWIFRPRRAAMRQLVLLVALIAGLLVPFAPRWGDGWDQHRPQEPSTSLSFPRSAWERTPGRSASRLTPELDATQGVAHVLSHAERGNEQIPLSGGRQPPETSEPLGRRRLIVLCLVSCWTFVAAYQIVRCFCGWILLRRLRRESVEATGITTDLFAACRAEMHVGNAVRLAIHPHVRSPILLGCCRPRIIVPPDWPQRSIAAQRAGLLHELAHVRRRDHLLAPLLEIVRIAFFFHPPVRWLLARLEHERELLCDEMVVRLGIDRRDYARLLLEFARSSGRLAWPAVSLPMSRRRTVKGRIYHLLEEDMERWIRPLPARWAIVLGGGLLALSLGLASYRVWAEEKEKAETSTQKAEQQHPPSKPADSTIKREELRYGGKDFNQWRRDILTELKGSIRVDGIRAFAAFGANGYGPEAAQAILEIMRGYDVTQDNPSHDDGAVVMAGYQAVRKIGAAALPALMQAVEGKNRKERLFAIQALEQMKTDARAAVPVLLMAMKNEDVTTRIWSLNAVRKIDFHAKGYAPALIEALKDKDSNVRNLAVLRLRDVKREAAKPAIPTLLVVLRDNNFEARLTAIQTLNMIGPEKQGVGAVSRLLQDENQSIRSQAYKFLQSLGPDAKGAVPALIAVLKARDDIFIDAAVDTLAKIGPAAKEAVPELTKLLRSNSDGLLQKAMRALEQISPNEKRYGLCGPARVGPPRRARLRLAAKHYSRVMNSSRLSSTRATLVQASSGFASCCFRSKRSSVCCSRSFG